MTNPSRKPLALAALMLVALPTLAQPPKSKTKRPAASRPAAGQPTLADVLDAAYFRKIDVEWEPTAASKRATVERATLDFAIARDEAVLTAEAKVKRNPDSSFDHWQLLGLSSAVNPEERPRGGPLAPALLAECKALADAHLDADYEFDQNKKEPSPTGTGAKRGKIVEATATFSYDPVTDKVKYRMEIKRLAAANPAAKRAAKRASPSGPTLARLLDEAYFREPLVTWKKTATGKRATTEDGFKLDFTITADQAVLVADATIGRTPDGAIDTRKLVEFSAAVGAESKPKPDRVGPAGVKECKLIDAANEDALIEFIDTSRKRSPKASAAKKGKLIEATATYAYDDAKKKVTYRMEIKRIN